MDKQTGMYSEKWSAAVRGRNLIGISGWPMRGLEWSIACVRGLRVSVSKERKGEHIDGLVTISEGKRDNVYSPHSQKGCMVIMCPFVSRLFYRK